MKRCRCRKDVAREIQLTKQQKPREKYVYKRCWLALDIIIMSITYIVLYPFFPPLIQVHSKRYIYIYTSLLAQFRI